MVHWQATNIKFQILCQTFMRRLYQISCSDWYRAWKNILCHVSKSWKMHLYHNKKYEFLYKKKHYHFYCAFFFIVFFKENICRGRKKSSALSVELKGDFFEPCLGLFSFFSIFFWIFFIQEFVFVRCVISVQRCCTVNKD